MLRKYRENRARRMCGIEFALVRNEKAVGMKRRSYEPRVRTARPAQADMYEYIRQVFDLSYR